MPRRATAVLSVIGMLVLAGCGESSHSGTSASVTILTSPSYIKTEFQSQASFTDAVTTQGDPNTPCHATASLHDGTLEVGVALDDPGEVVIEPYVHSGPILRKDYQHVPAGPTPLAVFHSVKAVDSIAVVEYTSAHDSHDCSVRSGDPS